MTSTGPATFIAITRHAVSDLGAWLPAARASLAPLVTQAGCLGGDVCADIDDPALEVMLKDERPDVVMVTAITPAIYKAQEQLKMARRLFPRATLVLGGDDGSLVSFAPLDRHPGFPGAIHAYDPRSNAWSDAGKMPKAHVTVPLVRWGEAWIMPSGEVRPGVRSPAVWSLRLN